MPQPLVTIIGLSYNQAPFIAEALDSVLAQTYPHIQVILADDGSSDGSADMLQHYHTRHPHWKLLLLPENRGNTVAFNRALQLAEGKYIIDFALDDVLLPGRVAMQVAAFEQLPEQFGLLYTNAQLINQHGQELGLFYPAKPAKNRPCPTGNVFAEVLAHSFICTPTVMLRKTVLDGLGGYDETLAYEDFDLFVRAARNWHFGFLNLPLTKKRIWQGSMSQGFYRSNRLPYFQTTLQVCRKAAALVQTPDETAALRKRLRFELRQAVFTQHHQVVPGYTQLLAQTGGVQITERALMFSAKLQLPLAGLFRFYHRLRGSSQVT